MQDDKNQFANLSIREQKLMIKEAEAYLRWCESGKRSVPELAQADLALKDKAVVQPTLVLNGRK